MFGGERMAKEKQTFITSIAAAYFELKNKMSVSFKKGIVGRKGYLCKKYPELVSSFGWEGDKDAPIAYIDGSFSLRDRRNVFITFGIRNIDTKVSWYNKEGWLPCFVSEFGKGKCRYKIENFADCVSVDGNDFEIVYSRLTVTNNGSNSVDMPEVSSLLVPLCAVPEKIDPGKTETADYAVGADRFGKKISYPSNSKIRSLGSFDEHYNHMKSYWTSRLEPLCEIEALPDERLINAYKAGYVYTMIVKDGNELHVGENGYDRVFDHDVIGILVYLLTMGDYKNVKEYAKFILKNPQYPDARWKYSWFFAYYLFKTGDKDYILSEFEEIRKNARSIETDIDSATGVMKNTNAIDSNGSWTIDNWSALMGLRSYEYICDYLGRADESKWAKSVYSRLFASVNAAVTDIIEKKNLDYLPISLTESNEEGKRSNPKDANWASMFLFGRWAWDGWLFCAEQSGPMINLIDATYKHGFDRRKGVCASRYNFGGYPHGYFSSAYNAGYGSTALRADSNRDLGIKAYQYMIENAMSGPFSWWEGIGYPSDDSPWNIPHASGGGGSCPHIWGQSTASKVLLDSLICQRTNGDIIIGRGVPAEWLKDGNVIAVNKYPIENSGRINMRIAVNKNEIKITVSGSRPSGRIIADLPRNGFSIITEENYDGHIG